MKDAAPFPDILRCPVCFAALQLDAGEGQGNSICRACGQVFGTLGGVPVLLDPARSAELVASVERHGAGASWNTVDEQAIAFSRASSTTRHQSLRRALTFLRYPYARVAAPPDYPGLHETYARGGHVLSLGGGSTSPSLPGWINCDILPYATVDIVGDACNLPFRDDSFELIVCNSMLEHVPDYSRVVTECRRILKPSGHFYLCVPQVCGRHHTIDYWRWTLPGLSRILREFDIVAQGARLGPAMFLPHLLEAIVEGSVTRPMWLREACRSVVLWIALPLRLLDKIAAKSQVFQHYAHTIWAVGRKPAS